MTSVRFEKWEGAGNDFVVLRAPSPRPDRETIRALLDRQRGIGGDGLLYIERGTDSAVIDYWNPDGVRVEYCGNGARCMTALLLDESGTSSVRFRLSDVTVEGRSTPKPGRYSVLQAEPEWKGVPTLDEPDFDELLIPGPRPTHIVAGVPHLILPVRDVDAFPLDVWGPRLRYSSAFAPQGINVDIVEVECEDGEPLDVVIARGTATTQVSRLRVRTWERGVEAETQACGSGLLAVGYWAQRSLRSPFPIRLQSTRDDFSLDMREGRYALTGPARRVFFGEVTLS